MRRNYREMLVAIVALALMLPVRALPAQPPDSAMLRPSLALLFDGSAYGQDQASKKQIGVVPPTGHMRTNRLILDGILKAPTPFAYSMSVDYNGIEHPDKTAFSLTDLAIIVPISKLLDVSLGRQKEGVTEQMMSSTRVIALTERAAPITAFLPTRNDGLRLGIGDAPHGRLSLGWFHPVPSINGPVPDGSNQAAGRVFFTPVLKDDESRVFQFGASARWTGAIDGTSRFRSRPEQDEAPYVVDTDKFPSRGATMLGLETLVQQGALSIEAEGLVTRATVIDSAAATFPAYFIQASWRPGGEIRTYDARNGTLTRVRLRGHATWELATRYSHTDLTSESVAGGVLDLASAAASWYPARTLRLTGDYGYSVLRRGGTTGRLQLGTLRATWDWR